MPSYVQYTYHSAVLVCLISYMYMYMYMYVRNMYVMCGEVDLSGFSLNSLISGSGK